MLAKTDGLFLKLLGAFVAGKGARDLQAREVRTRDEQHGDCDAGHQPEQAAADVVHVRRVQIHRTQAAAGVFKDYQSQMVAAQKDFDQLMTDVAAFNKAHAGKVAAISRSSWSGSPWVRYVPKRSDGRTVVS